MTLSIMLTIMVIGYDDHTIAIELSRLEGWELVDKGLRNKGGIAEFYLKDRKETIVFPVHKDKDWKDLKDFMNKNVLNISKLTKKQGKIIVKDELPF